MSWGLRPSHSALLLSSVLLFVTAGVASACTRRQGHRDSRLINGVEMERPVEREAAERFATYINSTEQKIEMEIWALNECRSHCLQERNLMMYDIF